MRDLRQYFIDTSARVWISLGNRMGRRPFQMMGIVIGLTILAGSLYFSLDKALDNSKDITEIQQAFCSSRAEFVDVEANCRQLVDRLLKAATPEQVEALRKLLEGAP